MLTNKFKAIIPLSCIFATNTAFAFGLGEIQVESSLGDPLSASIRVLDAPKELEASCFKLKRQNESGLTDPMRANVTLKKKSGDVILHIVTPQAINDPILQLAVISECESLQRDYVVLLDPPLVGNQKTDIEEPQIADRPNIVKKASGTASKQRSLANRKAKKSGSRTVRRNASVQSALNAPANTPASASPSAVAAEAQKKEAGLLEISGAEIPAGNVENPKYALRMDAGLLNISQSSSPANAGDDVTELSDDSAALSHRLEHLESQLVVLQKRNAELERMNKTAVAEVPVATVPTAQDLAGRWWPFMLGLVLLSGVAVSSWLKYRKNRLADRESNIWSATTQLAPEDGKVAPVPVKQTEEIENFESLSSGFGEHKVGGGTEINEDILDQAEVFVAHGRSNFAIQVLQDHLKEAPNDSPEPWLLLLDLLKRDGMKQEYQEAREKCMQHFNIRVVDYSEPSPAGANGGDLEDYPHVVMELQQLWGTKELEPYLMDLIYNVRTQPRQGFESNAYRDLLFILAIAKENG